MTRTISKNVFIRLAAEANEADLCGDTKTADSVTKQIQKYATDKVRPEAIPILRVKHPRLN